MWRYSYAARGEFDLDGARSTPAVDAHRVFTVGPLGQVYCFDRVAHRPVWKRNLLADFHGVCPRWGVAQSPLLYGELLIVAPQSAATGVTALRQTTGKVVWRSAPLGLMSYASPLLTSIDHVTQLVMLTSGKDYRANTIVAGLDPADGKFSGVIRSGNASSPWPARRRWAMGASF